MSYMDKYEAVIGLEVHVELKTRHKIFCSCESKFGGEPNTRVCPVCYGMPGTLPVLSKEAVALAVRAGIVLRCRINKESTFDRKNYYYPDLPKGYQITQYRNPICSGGGVPIKDRTIELERIHIEEDAGKLIHRDGETLIDYNRCGVPLIEIVSRPDIRTPDEAREYLSSMRRLLSYSGVSDCKMNEGSLRCDVNVSVRQIGEEGFGARVELKNLNSVNYVGQAIAYEIERQCGILESGSAVISETRRYNEDTGCTERMRAKENAVDYRYIAEPNIPKLVLTNEYIAEVKRQMPKTAEEISSSLVEEYGVKPADTDLITRSPVLAQYFMECAERTEYRGICANLFIGEVLPKLGEECEKTYIIAPYMAEICDLFGDGKITSPTAKKLIHLSAESGESPLSIAKREQLLKITDANEIMALAKDAVASDAKAVADFKRGKTAVVKQFVGSVMRISGGRADPRLAEEVIKNILENV